MTLVQLESASRVRDIDLASLERELRNSISGDVHFDTLFRSLYSTDASVYQITPLGVVIPKNRQDISRVVQICGRYKCPITVRGGGTSQAGQAIGEGLQLDTSKYYNRVLEVSVEDLWARVEPGVVLDQLNAQLLPLGVRFAPDISTASRATIGGMMANNSCGARSVIYGKTIDHVLEQIVLLSDGSVAHFREIDRTAIPKDNTLEASCYQTVLELARDHADEIERRFPKVLRRVMGYNLDEFVDQSKPVNLAKMMVGSEGTLGIVLEAKVRLVPLPKAKAVMVIGFHNILESLSAAPAILRHNPSAVEVMDKAILDNTRQNANLDSIRRQYVAGDPAATLCVEMYADRKEDLPPRMATLEQDLRSQELGFHYHAEFEISGQARIWSLREAALGLSMAMKEDAKSISFVEDTAVAPDQLSEYIGKFLKIIERHQTTAGIYAHASVGCLHVRPVINMKSAEGVAKFASIAQEVADLVMQYGGAISGEHGDGYVRSPFMRQMFGNTLYDAFRTIKKAFDPHGLFNPGKIVDSPPITDNLRFGNTYRAANPHTHFDFSEYGGFAGAVEMCSGVGACRKTLTGNMCPSYMATRNESDVTRGRANALRLAMSGQMGEEGLTSDSVYQALDLCLECRACKAECPVNVDVARFKSEFLAHYYEAHGTPLSAQALGHAKQLAELGSRFAPLSNWLMQTYLARWINQQFVGVDLRRRLPKWKRRTFAEQIGRNVIASGTSMVTVFNDTFTNHYDPEIGMAAIEILRKGGYGVNVVRPGCCGRPLISKGFLGEARTGLENLISDLFAVAQSGEPILFLEPSCLSAVKEDAVSLLRGEHKRRAEIVAGVCVLWDEFVSDMKLPLREGPKRILLHGHCHQKAMGLLASSVKLLSQIPSASVVDLDAGCCGMAGSFGYSKEHYDVSVKIANRKLLPAALAMNEGDVLVALGTSCRHQVADLANIAAVHPAQLIAGLLG